MKKLVKNYGWVVVIIICIIFIVFNSPIEKTECIDNTLINMDIPGPADLDIPERINPPNE